MLWLFGLGWAIARSHTVWTRLATSAVALACVPGWSRWGTRAARMVIVAGLLALIWVPAVRLPRPVVRVLTPLAAASLFI